MCHASQCDCCIRNPLATMMHPSSIFVALLAAAQLSGGLSFVVVARSTSLQSCLTSTSHASHGAKPKATPLLSHSRVRHTTTTATHAASDVATATALPRRARRRSRLGAAGDASAGEENASASASMPSETSSVAPGSSEEALVNSVGDVTAPPADAAVGGGGAAGGGVDLSKGIAFEAPKPKTGEVEVEEESKSKKVRAVL